MKSLYQSQTHLLLQNQTLQLFQVQRVVLLEGEIHLALEYWLVLRIMH